MSDYGDGNFMDVVSPWAPLSSPSIREILAILETDNGLNPISDAFLQTNQSEQRPGLVERVAARIGRNIPPLRIENMSPFSPFKNPKTVPFAIEISPGYNPSVMLQSPSQIISPYLFPNDETPEAVENFGNNHAMMMAFNNNVPYQPMHFDLPPQEGFYVIPTENSGYIPSHESHVDPIAAPLVASSFESEVADDNDLIMSALDDDSADEQEVKPPSPKRRKYEVSNMMTTTITSKVPRVTFRVETDEDQPYDGYRWRKYGRKMIKGNPNPRSYYKCSHKGCTVKKHVERAADNVKMLVVTYDGVRGYPKPVARSSSSSGPKNHSRSSVPACLGRPPFSCSSSAAPNMKPFPYPSGSVHQDMRPFDYPSATATQDMRLPFHYASALATQNKRPFPSSLKPGVDMTHLYMQGLSKLPSLPVNQNHQLMGQNAEPWGNQNYGFMGQNDEPKTGWYRGLHGDHGASIG